MHPEVLRKCKIKAGIRCDIHGFRSSFLTWAAEEGIDDTLADKCLSHEPTLIEIRRPLGYILCALLVPIDARAREREVQQIGGERGLDVRAGGAQSSVLGFRRRRPAPTSSALPQVPED